MGVPQHLRPFKTGLKAHLFPGKFRGQEREEITYEVFQVYDPGLYFLRQAGVVQEAVYRAVRPLYCLKDQGKDMSLLGGEVFPLDEEPLQGERNTV